MSQPNTFGQDAAKAAMACDKAYEDDRQSRYRATLTTQALLDERATTHGKFEDNARIGQHLRAFYRAQPGWAMLNDVQREALDYDIGKTSRILSGQGGYKDHWDDKAGYAKLVSNGGQQ